MKRKAEQAELQMMQNSHWTKAVRTESSEFPSFVGDRSNTQWSTDCQTPAKPIPVFSSTPFSSGPVPQWSGKTAAMEGADAELRRVVDNFVSIYEQLDKCEGSDIKPNYSYTELAYLAMLRSPNFCLPITEIYRYIQSRFLFFKNSTRKHWKNAVRHSLAKTMCFTKIAIGRGISNSENLSRSTYLWCIVPNSIVSFARGDYRPSVDKESGTNTLRWGYMRVNAGQFWDQVGNYIANKMASFRKFLQESPHPGQIFEQQVCQTPDLNSPLQFQMPDTLPNSYNRSPSVNEDKQFGCHGYRETPHYVYGLSHLLDGVETRNEPILAVPAQGYVTSLPFCNYGNTSVLGNMNSVSYRDNHCMTSPLCNTANIHSDRFTPPLRSTPSHRSTPPQRLSTPNGSTPSRTIFDTNDSGFESCGSSPDTEPGYSCRLPLQESTNQYPEKFSVTSCDFVASDLPLDFSFNEPDLSSFCDNLLSNSLDIKAEDCDMFHDLEDQSYMKENIPTTDWFNDSSVQSGNRRPTVTMQQQQQLGYYGDCRFSGLDSQSSLVNSSDIMVGSWHHLKPWF